MGDSIFRRYDKTYGGYRFLLEDADSLIEACSPEDEGVPEIPK